jgi:hypothetical protein
MTGVASSVEAALTMDEVMRSAAIVIARDLEDLRFQRLLNFFWNSLGADYK